MMMKKVRDQPSTTQEELVNDLKAVGTGPQSQREPSVTHYTVKD